MKAWNSILRVAEEKAMVRLALVSVISVLSVLTMGGCGGGGGGGGSSQQLEFTASDFTVNENGTAILPVTVRRTGGTSGDVSATITLGNGTAVGATPPLVPPSDFDNTAIVVAFVSGDGADKIVNIPILDDNAVEGNETLSLTLGIPTGAAAIGPTATAALTIVDDDSVGSVQFSSANFTYHEDGTAVAAITVQRIGGIDGVIGVTVTSTDGSATSDANSLVEPVDYTAIATIVAFGDQDGADKTVMFPIVADVLPELDETFTLALSQPTGGAVVGAGSAATVTIEDDDAMLVIPNPTPQLNARFGTSVAKVSSRLAIGSPGSAGGGRVPLFDPASATVSTTILPFLGSPAQYGLTLASSGINVLIGGNNGGTGGVEERDGFTYAFRFAWGGPGSFGQAMAALGNDRIAFGAPFVQCCGSAPSGAFYVFDDLTGQAHESFVLTSGAGEFGWSMSLMAAGDLLVGAPGTQGYVQRYSGNPLMLVLTINHPMPTGVAPHVRFGEGLAAIGDVIVVGSPDEDIFGSNAGALYFFDGTTGVLLNTIPPPSVVASGRFGSRIVAIGDRLCVQQQNGGPLGSGRIFVLDANGFLVQTIDDPVASAGANFGVAMCEFDGALVVGAPMQDVSGIGDVGVSYIFKLN